MKLNKINSLTILAQYYKNESKWIKTNVLMSQTNMMSKIFWQVKVLDKSDILMSKIF